MLLSDREFRSILIYLAFALTAARMSLWVTGRPFGAGISLMFLLVSAYELLRHRESSWAYVTCVTGVVVSGVALISLVSAVSQ